MHTQYTQTPNYGILLPSGIYMACTKETQQPLMRQLSTKDAFLAIFITPHAITHHLHNNTNRDVHPMKDAMYQALNIHDAYKPHIIITHAQRSWLDTHHTAFTQEQQFVYEECFTKRQHDYHTITPLI